VTSEDLKIQQRAALAAARQSGRPLPGTVSSAMQTGLLPSNIAAPGAIPAVAGEQYLVFSLLDYEFAIKAEYIQSVERLVDVTPVPNIAPWVKGVINLRGSIASVVDLRGFLRLEALPYNPRTRLLAAQYNEMVICLVVDGVTGMYPVPETAITDIHIRQANIPQWAVPYAAGTTLLEKQLVVLLEAGQLLFSDKMQHYEVLE